MRSLHSCTSQVNQLLNMYEQSENRQQYEKLQEQLQAQLAQLQNAYGAKAEEVCRCKSRPHPILCLLLVTF